MNFHKVNVSVLTDTQIKYYITSSTEAPYAPSVAVIIKGNATPAF